MVIRLHSTESNSQSKPFKVVFHESVFHIFLCQWSEKKILHWINEGSPSDCKQLCSSHHHSNLAKSAGAPVACDMGNAGLRMQSSDCRVALNFQQQIHKSRGGVEHIECDSASRGLLFAPLQRRKRPSVPIFSQDLRSYILFDQYCCI